MFDETYFEYAMIPPVESLAFADWFIVFFFLFYLFLFVCVFFFFERMFWFVVCMGARLSSIGKAHVVV